MWYSGDRKPDHPKEAGGCACTMSFEKRRQATTEVLPWTKWRGRMGFFMMNFFFLPAVQLKIGTVLIGRESATLTRDPPELPPICRWPETEERPTAEYPYPGPSHSDFLSTFALLAIFSLFRQHCSLLQANPPILSNNQTYAPICT